MTTRLALISHGSTKAQAAAAFGADEPIEARGLAALGEIGRALPKEKRALAGPELRCRQSAAALGLDAEIDPALRDLDSGAWRGQTLSAIAARDSAGLAAWLADPGATPHGGESILALIARVAAWLEDAQAPGACVAVSHPSVIRAAIIHVLGAPSPSFWRIDIAPASVSDLRFDGKRWSLRATGMRRLI